jgi:hypothetical protein
MMGSSLFGSNQDYKIGICCFSTKHPVLRKKNLLALNQDHVFKLNNMTVYQRTVVHLASTIKNLTNRVDQYKVDIISI